MKRIIVLTIFCLGFASNKLASIEPVLAHKILTPIYSKYSEKESPNFESEPIGYVKPQTSLLNRYIKNITFFTKNIAGPCIGGIFTSAAASTITCLASSYAIKNTIGTLVKENICSIASHGVAALAAFGMINFGISNIKTEKDRFGKNYFRGATGAAVTACAAASYYAVKGACNYYKNS